jgi:hypothetical protein
MAVNVQNGSAVFFGVDDVFVPDFVVEGAAHGVQGVIFRDSWEMLSCGSILFILHDAFAEE